MKMKTTAAITSALMLVALPAYAQETTAEVKADATAEVDHKTTLSMADLPGNAHTNPAGTIVLHPILPTAFSISDNLEVKASLLGLFGGPNIGFEYQLMKTEDMAVSIEPSVSTIWGFAAYGAGAMARYSMRMGTNWLNLNAGASYAAGRIRQAPTGPEVPFTTFSVPVHVSYNIVADPRTIWDLRASTDVMGFIREIPVVGRLPSGTVGFAWYHSFGGAFQLGLGLDVFIGAVPEIFQTLARLANITLPAAIPIPIPDITFGWKF